MKFLSLTLALLALAAVVGCSSKNDPAPAPAPATSFSFTVESGSPLQADGSFGDPTTPTQPWQAPADSALKGVTLLAPAGGFTNSPKVTISVDATDIEYLNPGNLPILSPVVRVQAPRRTGSMTKVAPETATIHPINGTMTIRIPFTLPADENVSDTRLYYEDGYGAAVWAQAELEGLETQVGTPTSHAFIVSGSWATRFWVINSSTLVNTSVYTQFSIGNSWTFSQGETVSILGNGASHPNLSHLPSPPIVLDKQESRQYLYQGADGYYLAGELDFGSANEIEYVYLDEKAERPIRWIPYEVREGQSITRKVRIEKRTDYLQGFVSEPTLSEVTVTRTFSFLDELNTDYGHWTNLLVIDQTDSEGEREVFYFANGAGLVYAEQGEVGMALSGDYVNAAMVNGRDLSQQRRIDTRPYFLHNGGNRWDFNDGSHQEIFEGQSTPNLPALDGTLLEIRHDSGSLFFARDAVGAALVAELGEVPGDPGNYYQNIYRGQGGPLTLYVYMKFAALAGPNGFAEFNAYADVDRRVVSPNFTDAPTSSVLHISWNYGLSASKTTPYGTFADVFVLTFTEVSGGYSERQYFARGVGLIQIDTQENDLAPWVSTHMTGGTVNGVAITPPPTQ